MSTEAEIMRELHDIREKLYDETKNLTDSERADFINKRAEAIGAQYGITLRKPAPRVASIVNA